MSLELTLVLINEIQSLIDKSQGTFLASTEEKVFKVEEFLNKRAEKDRLRLFELRDEDLEIGYISLLTNSEGEYDIGPMFIDSKYQGQGYGKKQVKLLLQWCTRNNIDWINTRTWEGNLASRKIFESLGFKLFRKVLNDRINGDSTIWYQKAIK